MIVIWLTIFFFKYLIFLESQGFTLGTRTAEQDPKNYIPIEPLGKFRDPNDKYSASFSSHYNHERHLLQHNIYKSLHEPSTKVESTLNTPFDNVQVSFPLATEIEFVVKGVVFVGERYIKKIGSNFTVYSMGPEILKSHEFEEALGAIRVSVHAFDCKASSDTNVQHVSFHPWCIGRSGSTSDSKCKNKSLSETKKELGHSHIHLLKLSIYGFNFDILQNDIINNNNTFDLPDQIIIDANNSNDEHSKNISIEEGQKLVNELIIGLWKRGYRLVKKVVGSRTTLTLVRIHN